MGSFRRLKLVLIIAGHPVRSRKAESRRWSRGWRAWSTVCTRAVPSTWVAEGMVERGWRCRSSPSAPEGGVREGDAAGGVQRGHQEHVGALLAQLEPLLHVIPQHDRGEGPERLPELDPPVEPRLHPEISGVGQDAAGAQGAGAELHPSLEPAHHPLLLDQGGRSLAELLIAAAGFEAGAHRLQEGAHDAVGEAGSQQRGRLPVGAGRGAGILQKLVPEEEGRAQGTAGVPGGGAGSTAPGRGPLAACGRWPSS